MGFSKRDTRSLDPQTDQPVQAAPIPYIVTRVQVLGGFFG